MSSARSFTKLLSLFAFSVLAFVALEVVGFSFAPPAFAVPKWCKANFITSFQCRKGWEKCASTPYAPAYPNETGLDCPQSAIATTSTSPYKADNFALVCPESSNFGIAANVDNAPLVELTWSGNWSGCREHKIDKKGNIGESVGGDTEILVAQVGIGSKTSGLADFEGCTATVTALDTELTAYSISCNAGPGKQGKTLPTRGALWYYIPISNTDFICPTSGPGGDSTSLYTPWDLENGEGQCFSQNGLPPDFTNDALPAGVFNNIAWAQGEYLKTAFVIKNTEPGNRFWQYFHARIFSSGSWNGDDEPTQTKQGHLLTTAVKGSGVLLLTVDIGPQYDDLLAAEDITPFLFSRGENRLYARIVGDVDTTTIDIDPPSGLKLKRTDGVGSSVGAVYAHRVLNPDTNQIDIIAAWNTQALDDADMLADLHPGDVPSFTVAGSATVGESTFPAVGADTVMIAQSVFADYRAGCGWNLSLKNTTNLGSDNIVFRGGAAPYQGDPAVADDGDSDNDMSGQVAGGATLSVEGVPVTGLTEAYASGASCGNTTDDEVTIADQFFTTGDGASPDTEGVLDLMGTISVQDVYNNSRALQNACTGIYSCDVGLAITGTDKDGVPWKGTAWVHVNK